MRMSNLSELRYAPRLRTRARLMALASWPCLFPLILSFPGAMLAFQSEESSSFPSPFIAWLVFNCEILGHRQTHEGTLETGTTLNARNLQSPETGPRLQPAATDLGYPKHGQIPSLILQSFCFGRHKIFFFSSQQLLFKFAPMKMCQNCIPAAYKQLKELFLCILNYYAQYEYKG